MMNIKQFLVVGLALLGLVACKVDVNEPENSIETIELSVDVDEIMADGQDYVRFTVISDGQDVTRETTIFYAGGASVLVGHTFHTTQPGVYRFYAMKGDVTSNEVTVTAKEVSAEPQVITLTASSMEIFVGEEVIFTVHSDEEDITSAATIYHAEDNTPLSGRLFKATEAGTYRFYAMLGEEVSNRVTITVNEPEIVIEEITLTATATDVKVGEQVRFTVVADHQNVTELSEIFNAQEDELLEGAVFVPEQAGTFEFYATYQDVISNTVTITVSEVETIDLVLVASQTEILANGTDFVEFTVSSDGADVTGEVDVMVKNGGKLNGTKFSTTTAGEYTFYAQMGEFKSNEITVSAKAVSGSGKSIVFAEGVTMTSGWYDVNKMGQGELNGDINMCWAASSANMIQWWQDRYVAAGNTLPSTTVTGPGTVVFPESGRAYELALMEVFYNEWDNRRGCNTTEAIPWFFEGVNYGATASPGSQAVPLTPGGYWASIWDEVYPYMYHEYSYMFGWYTDLYVGEFNAYMNWGQGSSLVGMERYKKFSDLVVEFIGRGVASMTISLNSNGGLLHATTLWGYEIDNATGLVTRLWITDSDDLLNEPKQQLLNEYTVSYRDGDAYIQLTSDTVRYRTCFVSALAPFSGYGSGSGR